MLRSAPVKPGSVSKHVRCRRNGIFIRPLRSTQATPPRADLQTFLGRFLVRSRNQAISTHELDKKLTPPMLFYKFRRESFPFDSTLSRAA